MVARTTVVNPVKNHLAEMEEQLMEIKHAVHELQQLANRHEMLASSWNQRADSLDGVDKGYLHKHDLALNESDKNTLTKLRDAALQKAQKSETAQAQVQEVLSATEKTRDELTHAVRHLDSYDKVNAASVLFQEDQGQRDLPDVKAIVQRSRRAVHEAHALMEIGAGRLEADSTLELGT